MGLEVLRRRRSVENARHREVERHQCGSRHSGQLQQPEAGRALFLPDFLPPLHGSNEGRVRHRRRGVFRREIVGGDRRTGGRARDGPHRSR